MSYKPVCADRLRESSQGTLWVDKAFLMDSEMQIDLSLHKFPLFYFRCL